MPENFNVLTDEDMAILRRFLDQEKKNQKNTVTQRNQEFRPENVSDGSPEVYVAMPPCGDTIPARVGENPGAAVCCIFRILINPKDDRTSPPGARTLAPVLNPDGTQLRRTVYNVYDYEWPEYVEYIIIRRTAYGRWVCEEPNPTTTTSEPTTTTGTAAPNPCTGTCDWYWSSSSEYWFLNNNNCNAATTTTPEPPTQELCSGVTWYQCFGGKWEYVSDSCNSYCEASNHPLGNCTNEGATVSMGCLSAITEAGDVDNCLCPGSGGSPGGGTPFTTSTTTTTPEPAVCECLYPTFCGTTDQEETSTYCSDQVNEPPDDCPPTSTTTTTTDPSTTTTTGDPTTTTTGTTCDCNTTTSGGPTTAPPDCSTGCQWEWLPTYGGGFGWRLQSGGCASNCPCPTPDHTGGPCESVSTSCISTTAPPPPPPPPACSGSCTYWWIPSSSSWVFMSSSCSGGTNGCFCQAPSGDGSGCAPSSTPCVAPTSTAPPSTTTVNPGGCHDCYTTTTLTPPTTTTTCVPCSHPCEGCTYVSSDDCGALILTEANCTGDCGCPDSYPFTSGPSGGTVVMPCVQDPPPPTTTTAAATTTTTTIAPCESHCDWKWSPECEDWILMNDPCNPECPCPTQEIPVPAPWPGTWTNTPCTPTTQPPTTVPPTTTVCPTTTSTTTAAPTTTTETTTTTSTTVCPTSTTEEPTTTSDGPTTTTAEGTTTSTTTTAEGTTTTTAEPTTTSETTTTTTTAAPTTTSDGPTTTTLALTTTTDVPTTTSEGGTTTTAAPTTTTAALTTTSIEATTTTEAATTTSTTTTCPPSMAPSNGPDDGTCDCSPFVGLGHAHQGGGLYTGDLSDGLPCDYHGEIQFSGGIVTFTVWNNATQIASYSGVGECDDGGPWVLTGSGSDGICTNWPASITIA